MAFTHPAPVQKSTALMPSEAALHPRESMEREKCARARALLARRGSVRMRDGLKMLLTQLPKKYTRCRSTPACARALQPTPVSQYPTLCLHAPLGNPYVQPERRPIPCSPTAGAVPTKGKSHSPAPLRSAHASGEELGTPAARQRPLV
jgi:hypothetical protein